MKYVPLSAREEKKVKQFFLNRFRIPLSFWQGKELRKRVHSVWVCSKTVAELAPLVRVESVGLMLLLELETLKPSKQGIAFLQNMR